MRLNAMPYRVHWNAEDGGSDAGGGTGNEPLEVGDLLFAGELKELLTVSVVGAEVNCFKGRRAKYVHKVAFPEALEALRGGNFVDEGKQMALFAAKDVFELQPLERSNEGSDATRMDCFRMWSREEICPNCNPQYLETMAATAPDQRCLVVFMAVAFALWTRQLVSCFLFLFPIALICWSSVTDSKASPPFADKLTEDKGLRRAAGDPHPIAAKGAGFKR